MKLKHLIVLSALFSSPQQVAANGANTDLSEVEDSLRVIKNLVIDTLPSLSHSETVRINHEIQCARDFTDKAKSGSSLVQTTPTVAHSELQHGRWNEISSFNVGYGEHAYILPIGTVKWSPDASPEHPLEYPGDPDRSRLEFARKIGERIGPAIKYRGDAIRVNAPDGHVATVVWRVNDDPHIDNSNESLEFAFFVYGGIGSMETSKLKHPCDF